MARRPALHDLLHAAPPDCGDRDLLDRYLTHGDQAAFAALLHRHGPLVLGLSRRLLRDAHLAEDVFQATFLVLARKAHTIRKRDSVSSWLHGVAARLARQARLSEAAFASRQVRGARKEGAVTDPSWDDLLRVLQEELALLPDRFRAPLLLCYLEGHTQDEAATHLGWSLRTLRRRLEDGRERLRERLTKRGATLGAGLFAAALSPAASAAVVSEPLRQAVFAVLEADAAGSPLPAAVALLANQGLTMMTLSKLFSFVAVVTLLGGALTATALQPRREETPPAKVAAEPPNAAEPLPRGAVTRLGTFAFRHGRVHEPSSLGFTPDGKHLISAGGGWVRRWDPSTGEAVVTIDDSRRAFRVSMPYGFVTADGRVCFQGNSVEVPGRGNVWRWKEHDLATGKERRTFDTPWPPVRIEGGMSLANHLSPDGKVLASLQDQHAGTVTLWTTADGSFLHHLKPEKAPFTCLAFLPDGKSVLLGDAEHRLHLYDLQTAHPRSCGEVEKDHCVSRMAVSPDGRWVATAGGKKGHNPPIYPHDTYVRLWDMKTGKVVHTLTVPENGGARKLLFTPDSRTLLAGLQGYEKGRPAAVRTWDVATGKPGRAWTDDASIGLELAVSPDDKRLATMSGEGVIRQWDMAGGKEIRPLHASPCAVKAVCFLPDGKRLLTAGSDLSLREWDAANGKLLRVTPTDGKGFRSELVAGGALLSVVFWNADNSTDFRVFDTTTGKLLLQRRGAGPVFTSNGKLFAGYDKDHRVQVIDVASHKVVHTLVPPAGDEAIEYRHPWPIAFSTDGRRLILLGQALSVWDTTTGALYSSWNLVENNILPGRKNEEEKRHSWDRIEGWAVSPDGKTVALGMLKDRPGKPGAPNDWFGRVYLLDAAGKLLRQIDLDEFSPEQLAFSPDGKRLALGGMWAVQVWDVATGKKLHEFEGHRGKINQVAFSKDGTRLASASEDSSVLIWDVSVE